MQWIYIFFNENLYMKQERARGVGVVENWIQVCSQLNVDNAKLGERHDTQHYIGFLFVCFFATISEMCCHFMCFSGHLLY